MKVLGCLGVVVLAFAGFLALAAYVIARGDDMSALTQRIEVTVTDSREDSRRGYGQGWQLDYAYERGGRWYGGDEWLPDSSWGPGEPLTACVDPERPRAHVLTADEEACGQDVIDGNFITEGTPRPAPSPRP